MAVKFAAPIQHILTFVDQGNWFNKNINIITIMIL